MGKDLERILARRLSWIYVREKVVSCKHFGALPRRSAIDLTTCIIRDIERAFNEGRTARMLILDVKGVFLTLHFRIG